MSRIRSAVSACLLLAFAPLTAGAAGPATVLPRASTVKGWKQIGTARLFNSRTIFDLVDGEGEAILAYAFSGCAHGEYAPAKAAQPAVTVDVFDMSDALNAYGLFSSSDRASGKAVGIGTEGVRIGRSGINFWKGRYLVRTTLIGRAAAFPSNQAAMLAFARASAARISGAGGPPPLLKALPPGKQPGSERYVRANVAGHAFLSNGVTARYPAQGFGAELFICQYPGTTMAQTAFDRYRAYEKSGTGLAPVKGLGDAAFSVTDRFAKTVVVARKGRYVVGVVRARDVRGAQALVRKAVSGLR